MTGATIVTIVEATATRSLDRAVVVAGVAVGIGIVVGIQGAVGLAIVDVPMSVALIVIIPVDPIRTYAKM